MMKFKVRYQRRVRYRETIETVIEAESEEAAHQSFDDEEFLRYLVTEQLFEESDIIEGPIFLEVMDIENN